MDRVLRAFTILGLVLSAALWTAQTAHADPAKKEWFYAEGEGSSGPFSLAQMQAFISGALINAETQVFVERNGWRPAAEHPELSPAFAAAAPVPTPTPAQRAQPRDQKTLDAAAERFLVGTWRSEGTGNFEGETVHIVSTTSYLIDGTFTGVSTNRFSGDGSVATIQTNGGYEIAALDDVEFMVDVEYTRSYSWPKAPMKGKGKMHLRIIDENTVEAVGTGERSTRVR